MFWSQLRWLICGVLVVAPCGGAIGEEKVDFNRDIRPLLSSNCLTCHGPDEAERAAGLRLDTEQGAHQDLGGYAAVVPGDPESSEIIARLTSDDEDMRMPPEGKGRRLTDVEIDRIRRWIEQGGDYAEHWSYQVPVRPPLPEVESSQWPRNPIDYFVLAGLEARGLQPSPEASREVLARRVALDLTGLPPTWQEAQQFITDPDEKAYEKYVDRLLAKASFGERWARVWLDLARYADSAGYADDPPRTIWAYRDYVIRALNQNKPFDQFTIEQIAGDLLPEPSEEAMIATAFHRNTLTNNEGGTNNEEFRNVAVVDRVNTTMAVWMGTTMACAQCHTHKYDPITQEEYFQFFDFFNQTADADERDERPLLEIWSDEQQTRKQQLTARIAEVKSQLEQSTPELEQQRSQWLESLRDEPEWQTLQPVAATAEQRALEVTQEGWIRGSADKPANDTYRIKIPTDDLRLTALKLEVSEQQTSNFVLTDLNATWTPKAPASAAARFIRLRLPGKNRILHIAEIEAFQGDRNVAREGTATQSSTSYGGEPRFAIDGQTDGDFNTHRTTHTETENDPWLEIDLQQPTRIDRLVIWNRSDGGKAIAERLAGFEISLLDEDRKMIWQQQPQQLPRPQLSLGVDGSLTLKFTAAFADYQQPGFPATAVIAETPDKKSGWAVGGQTGTAHRLTVVLAEPQRLDAGTLTIELDQQSVHQAHLLDHFRLSATGDDRVADWARMPDEIRQLVQRDPQPLDGKQHDRLATYHRSIAPSLEPVRKELAQLEKQLAEMKPHTTVPVMRELPEDSQRVTKVQIRGNYQSTGATVEAGTPDVFHPLPEDLPPNRLALAKWLVDENNPLTARVIANRHWEQIFGTGIVETSEEFGSQGELPSHPELLDWLAVELRDGGWDIKALLRLMVTSATYRQSSVTSDELQQADPQNRFLARGPRFRISAEMVRDQALFVSGLLSDSMYGPPVKPPQPALGLTAAFGSSTDWETSDGSDRYRRGIYTNWRRSNPYPSMAQFDAPNREVCTVRRIRTNTPLQALVTLNDPVYVEAAQSLARRMVAAAEAPADRITFGFRESLIRDPRPEEIERLEQLVGDLETRFAADPAAARKLATDPLGPLPKHADPIELAAWTVVGNVILNLDEMYMKR